MTTAGIFGVLHRADPEECFIVSSFRSPTPYQFFWVVSTQGQIQCPSVGGSVKGLLREDEGP